MFRGRKPSKTWLQRESLTLEINDTICYNEVSDHYTANSTESLYSRYSQRYSHFQGKNVPSRVLSIFIEIYQPASSLAEGKEDKEFKNKPEIAIDLIDRSLTRGYRPKIVLIDAGYGNNTSFLKALEERKLKYLGGLAKNRKVIIEKEGGVEETIQLEQLAKSLSENDWEKITLNLDKEKTVWVAVFRGKISGLKGEKNLAIVMNASSVEKATEVDYFITNVVEADTVTASWIVRTYTERNWVEVFYREAKGWLGLREYQVRDKRSLLRHFILVFCA